MLYLCQLRLVFFILSKIVLDLRKIKTHSLTMFTLQDYKMNKNGKEGLHGKSITHSSLLVLNLHQKTLPFIEPIHLQLHE